MKINYAAASGFSPLANFFKKSTVLCIMLALGFGIWAFDSSLTNLDSKLYEDLTLWQNAGYIRELPNLRPYSPEMVMNRLREALETLPADSTDAQRAADYLDQLSSATPSAGIGIEALNQFSTDGYFIDFRPDASFNWLLHSGEHSGTYAEMIYTANFVEAGSNGQTLPLYETQSFDAVDDWSDISLGFADFQIQQYTYGLLSQYFTSADGTSSTYFSIGTHRSSAGPIHDDGVILSSEAPAAGHFSLGYQRDLPRKSSSEAEDGADETNTFIPSMSYVSQMSALTATNDYGENLYGEKYMIFHNLHFDVAPWLSFGVVESVIWGERIELLYLVPLSSYFLSQGMVGFSDNSLIGLEATLRPDSQWRIPLTVYVDDLHFNDILSLHLDTKYKFAAQTGAWWTPLKPWLRSLSLDYTAVMPYMYTHIDSNSWDSENNEANEDTANYSNYTNNGQSMATSLDPNSDRIRLSWNALPISYVDREYPGLFRRVSLNGSIQFIRHGNASDYPGGSGWDNGLLGTIYDHGYYDGSATFQSSTQFLTQDVLQQTLQFSVGASARAAIFRRMNVDLSLGYTFEQIWNDNLIEGEASTNNYLQLSVMFSPEIR